METFDNSIYSGKKDFDNFIASLPKHEKNLTQNDQFSLALQVAEFFKRGIPHKDRSICLYYFYHFLGLEPVKPSNPELLKQFSSLPHFAASSLIDPRILEYIKLLDSANLYEVCQLRGEIKMFNIGLLQYIAGETTADWIKISKEAETFLASEPCQPQTFLEFYFIGMNHYCYKNKKQEPKRYELAQKVWATSTDLETLKSAWEYLNDPEVLRNYKKSTLPPKEIKKVMNLEQIEGEVIAEFGEENWRGRTTVGKALQLLTKEGRENKRALSEIRDEWYGKIKHGCGWGIFENDAYVKGYVAYLNAHVSAGTEDWKGAVKELKSSLENDFDPPKVLLMLLSLLDAMKKYDEAVDYAQRFIDISSFESNDHKDERFQPIFLIFRQIGRKPLWVNRIWEERAKQNAKNSKAIIAALDPQINAARQADIEQRIKLGIQVLDKLVSLEKADDALNNNIEFSKVSPESRIDDFLELSLEELEPFAKAGTDKLMHLYSKSISLENLLNYNEEVIGQLYGKLEEKFDSALRSFPNTLACIPVAKKKISALIYLDKQDLARLLADHLIKKRSNRVDGLYDAITPVIQQYNNQKEWRQEIELITKARKLLLEREQMLATSKLIETYVNILTAEESLNEKNRLLKLAESEKLNDDRLTRMREEIDALLYRRKQMLIKAGTIAVAALVLFFIIYFLFLK
jgi:hypothetical protein